MTPWRAEPAPHHQQHRVDRRQGKTIATRRIARSSRAGPIALTQSPGEVFDQLTQQHSTSRRRKIRKEDFVQAEAAAVTVAWLTSEAALAIETGSDRSAGRTTCSAAQPSYGAIASMQ
jgi:hypothetical protein